MIDFIQAVFAKAIAIILFQIGFGGVGEFHLHAPAVDGMHAFEGFSATGTGLRHRQQKKRSLPKKAPRKNINYLNNIALGNFPASNEVSSTPSEV